jgi:hypothetical protein
MALTDGLRLTPEKIRQALSNKKELTASAAKEFALLAAQCDSLGVPVLEPHLLAPLVWGNVEEKECRRIVRFHAVCAVCVHYARIQVKHRSQERMLHLPRPRTDRRWPTEHKDSNHRLSALKHHIWSKRSSQSKRDFANVVGKAVGGSTGRIKSQS